MRSIKTAQFGDVFTWSRDKHLILFIGRGGDEFYALNLTDSSEDGFIAGQVDPYLPHDAADPARAIEGGWAPVDLT